MVAVNQHKTVQERATACQNCVESLQVQMPTVLDSMENEFNDTYAAWPLRFYLIDNGVLEVIAMPTQGAYDLLDLDKWLQSKVPHVM